MKVETKTRSEVIESHVHLEKKQCQYIRMLVYLGQIIYLP